jgi:hypothetical protein
VGYWGIPLPIYLRHTLIYRRPFRSGSKIIKDDKNINSLQSFLLSTVTCLLTTRQFGRSRGRRTAPPAGRRARGPLGPQTACNSGRKCSTGAPLWSRRGRVACGTCIVPAPLPRSSGCIAACTLCAGSLPCRTRTCRQKIECNLMRV